VDHTYWVFGGYHLDGTKVKMAKYDLLTNTWSKGTDSGPIDRDGHTLTAYKVRVFLLLFISYTFLLAFSSDINS